MLGLQILSSPHRAYVCSCFSSRVWRTSALYCIYPCSRGARSRIFIQFQNPILHHSAPHCLCASVRVYRRECRLHLSRKASSVAGLLIGLSVYGYFIYLFLVPAAALHLWRRLWPNPQRRVVFVYWLAGFALGVSPYLIGFALMFAATGGAPGFERFIAAYIGGTHVLGSQLNIMQSLKYFFEIVSETIWFVGPSTMMLRKTYTPLFAGLKFLMLLAPATRSCL